MNTNQLSVGLHQYRHPLSAWLPVIIVTAVLAMSMLAEASAHLPFRVCLFWNVVGLPCPGCGMTCGFVAMGHGHLLEAWRCHPLSPLLFFGACAYVLTAILRRQPPRFPAERIPTRLRIVLGALILVAFLGSWALSLHRYLTQPYNGPQPLVAHVLDWLGFA